MRVVFYARINDRTFTCAVDSPEVPAVGDRVSIGDVAGYVKNRMFRYGRGDKRDRMQVEVVIETPVASAPSRWTGWEPMPEEPNHRG